MDGLHLFAPERADDQNAENHRGQQDHQQEEQNDPPMLTWTSEVPHGSAV
jgi:hypothetical protein